MMGTLLLQAFFRASYKEYQEGEKERDGLKKTLWANTKEQEGLAQKLLAVEQERDDLRIENEELIAELANEPEIVEQVFTGPQPGITTGLKPHPQELPSDAASRKHISRMSFRILELLPRGEIVIRGKTFEDCTIHGPSLLVLLGAGILERCDYGGDENSMFWEIAEVPVMAEGVIAVVDCVFRRCTFVGIGFAGTQEDIARWKQETAKHPPPPNQI